ncbi:MAG: hypothetical protein ATN33_01630, partial [Epulopiscium sp. Nele67-Bin001]
TALGVEENKYDGIYDFVITILIPNHKIVTLNYGNVPDDFEDFYDDWKDVLSYLVKTFKYNEILGRKKDWQSSCLEPVEYSEELMNVEKFLINIKLTDNTIAKQANLLISLLTGSINDVERVGANIPQTLLDRVKQKIILFDGMQSRFIYGEVDKDLVKIQGLAGTGKTELLLHKLKETYVNKKDSKIAFTCHNRILATDLKTRVPKFFDFMKVQEQIEWENRLWVFNSWGSRRDENSGLYSYICSYYGLTFNRYMDTGPSFESLCGTAIEELEQIENISPCFDYIFVDEGQDFGVNFINLCKKVTSNKVYLAGDIFQNIFDKINEQQIDCDYLLDKCYRTDPKTLMFAHAVGMGLYERPVIRWLEDEGWAACGYKFSRNGNNITFSRNNIRRFDEDNSEDINSMELIASPRTQIGDNIMACIKKIKQNNPTVKPEDIAIIFNRTSDIIYDLADQVEYFLAQEYQWNVCKGYDVKTREKDAIFISNINNVKGLEFPFVIGVEVSKINRDITQRNAIYMMLTRSFLTSYLVVNDINTDFIGRYKNAINLINTNGSIQVQEPSEEEKQALYDNIKIQANQQHRSLEDVINEVLSEYPTLDPKEREAIQGYVTIQFKEHDKEENVIKAYTEDAIKRHLKGINI